jgi:phospholipid-translocating ATPase
MIIYFFYKNFVFTIIHFFYGFYNNFSGQTIIDDWFIIFFNLIFTSIPLGVRGVLDLDLKDDDGILIYKLESFIYFDNVKNLKFNFWNFSLELIKGILQSGFNFFICINIVNSAIDKNGYLGCLWFISVNLFSNIILIVTIDLIVFTKYHTFLNFGLIFITTFFLYFLFIVIVQNFTFFNSYGIMNLAFHSIKMWLSLFLVSGTCFICELSILTYKCCFIDNVSNLLKKVDNLNTEKIPFEIQNYIDHMKISKDEKENERIKKNINYWRKYY